jgi:uncharacterized protein
MSAAAPEPLSPIAPPLTGRASASQQWSDLAFLHWRVPADAVAPLLPAGLVPDEFDGTSWVGLIAFVLERASIFGGPPIPYFGSFVEINVRLYAVDERGRRGVVFVSLDASRLAAVLTARSLFSLPYFWSSTQLVRSGRTVRYLARRHLSRRHLSRRIGSEIVVSPSTRMSLDDPLATFLTARWGLFAVRKGKTIYLPNQHEPWTLYRASVVRLDDTILAAAGFPGLTERPPDSVLYGSGVTTRFGWPQ